jgi:hypothetical protein
MQEMYITFSLNQKQFFVQELLKVTSLFTEVLGYITKWKIQIFLHTK